MVTRVQVVEAAREWVETPYVHQASVLGAGTDCLGLVRGVWRTLCGVEPEGAPSYTPFWTEYSGKELLYEAAQRTLVERCPQHGLLLGQVVLMRMSRRGPMKHCGIISGYDKFIHAYDSGKKVVESTLDGWWLRKITASFDFPGVE